jgi:hypothetical protein
MNSLENTFWKRVLIGNGCWVWVGGKKETGYGKFYFRGKYTRAHRTAWEIVNGQKIPPGLVVRHSCDNPACVRPGHLLLGTMANNVRDREERGRSAPTPNTLLTKQEVKDIKRRILSGDNLNNIAKDYKMSYAAIYDIKAERTWNSVPWIP